MSKENKSDIFQSVDPTKIRDLAAKWDMFIGSVSGEPLPGPAKKAAKKPARAKNTK